MNDGKKPLLGLTTSELRTLCTALGLPAFTGGQIAKWLYEKHVADIDEMTNLSKAARRMLTEGYAVGAAVPLHAQHSVDGTVKYLFPVACSEYCDAIAAPEARCVETVFIPDDNGLRSA